MKWQKNEVITWKQRSRILWLNQGDKNTKFFQRMANFHKRYNHIDKLEVQGDAIIDPQSIKGETMEFY